MYLSLGKFSSGRDDVLYSMCMGEWSNRSDGDSESPTGYFWLLCNSTDELKEVSEAFEDEITACEIDPSELVGNFIISTTSQGFVYVETHDSEPLALAHFEALQAEFADWSGEDEL